MRFAIALAALWLAAAPAARAQFRFRQSSPDTLELTENGKPVFTYVHGMVLGNGAPEARRRSGYLHPVHAPDGTVVTDDFPKDHYHHRGIFWTWPVVIVGGNQYDPWIAEGIKQKFVRWIERKGGGTASLKVENGWFAETQNLLRETVEIHVRPASSGRREMDFTLRFEALGQPVELRGEPGGDKGYGGFCARFAPRQQTAISTDKGKEPKDTNMQPHAWAQLEAVYQGHPAGLRIDIDPSNPGAPNGWCLRHYGFLGVNFPGLKPYIIEPGRPLRLKYRVTVYNP